MSGAGAQREFTPEAGKRIFDLVLSDKPFALGTWRGGDAELQRTGDAVLVKLYQGKRPPQGEHSEAYTPTTELTYTSQAVFVGSRNYTTKTQGGMQDEVAVKAGPDASEAGRLMQSLRKA